MTYVISDLHGRYDKFKEMLDIIGFSDSDNLFLLGDLVDYGDDSVELINDLSMRTNVFPIAGEHDFKAARMLGTFDKMAKKGSAPDASFVSEMTSWVKDGGGPTLEAFRTLDDDGKEGVLEYLADMTLYEETEAGGREYLMMHAGIAGFKEGSDPEDYEAEDFFDASADIAKMKVSGKTLVAGHRPSSDGRIKKSGNCVYVDCGVIGNDTLGCLRLDDGKEFYV